MIQLKKLRELIAAYSEARYQQAVIDETSSTSGARDAAAQLSLAAAVAVFHEVDELEEKINTVADALSEFE